jgi:hypothetical protein
VQGSSRQGVGIFDVEITAWNFNDICYHDL